MTTKTISESIFDALDIAGLQSISGLDILVISDDNRMDFDTCGTVQVEDIESASAIIKNILPRGYFVNVLFEDDDCCGDVHSTINGDH